LNFITAAITAVFSSRMIHHLAVIFMLLIMARTGGGVFRFPASNGPLHTNAAIANQNA
jgi:hypothetical protein